GAAGGVTGAAGSGLTGLVLVGSGTVVPAGCVLADEEPSVPSSGTMVSANAVRPAACAERQTAVRAANIFFVFIFKYLKLFSFLILSSSFHNILPYSFERIFIFFISIP
ncbi:hypothetical protein, partial [Faecalibaculum rodentium]|uniref:hypothetical protein n=1 Tax=Faecalibaculum rodentium TaxID=1702221 RepID=UPI00261058E1